MHISQKTQYSLRAVFELALRYGEGPARIGDIADAQAIPPRFLEVILVQLKRAGFVDSRRGNEGGYVLDRPPAALTVGQLLRFLEGPVFPVNRIGAGGPERSPMFADRALDPMWDRVRDAVSDVYDNTTFEDLVEEAQRRTGTYVPAYAI